MSFILQEVEIDANTTYRIYANLVPASSRAIVSKLTPIGWKYSKRTDKLSVICQIDYEHIEFSWWLKPKHTQKTVNVIISEDDIVCEIESINWCEEEDE